VRRLTTSAIGLRLRFSHWMRDQRLVAAEQRLRSGRLGGGFRGIPFCRIGPRRGRRAQGLYIGGSVGHA